MKTGFGRRARAAAISLLSVAALTLTACSGSGPVEDAVAENTIDAALAAGIEEAVGAAMQYSGSDSAIVGVWTGSGNYVQSFGTGADAGSAIRGAQATQPVICALLLELAAEGTVPLDRKVSEDLPRQVGIDDITYGQLCTAKTGLADFKIGLADVFTNNPTRPWSDRELFAQGLARSPLSWPGLDVHVSDTDALLLARALRVATGTPVSQLLQQYVFGPAGMTSSYYPADTLARTALPQGGLEGSTYPSAGGAPVCEAGVVAVPQVSPSMLGGAGASVTTVTDLKSFYEQYLGGSFGGELASVVTEATPTANPERDADGNPIVPEEGAVDDPNAQAWGFGVERLGTLYGRSGAITGTLTAVYHDPAAGFSVVVVLDNSSTGAGFVRALALQLAALAAEAGVGPAVAWTAADQGAALAAAAICQAPPEETPAEEVPAEEAPAE